MIVGGLDPEFEDMVEDELSEFEDKRKFNQILERENLIKEKEEKRKEDEKKAKEIAKLAKIQKQEDERKNKDKRQKEALAEKKKQFEAFQRVTYIKGLKDLVPRLEYLEYKPSFFG